MGRQEARDGRGTGELTETSPQSTWTDGEPRLHLSSWTGGGPPLLLVHGMGANTHWWDACAPLLAGSFKPVALDLSGHGDSGRRETYSLESWVADIEGARRALGWQKFALVGHSLGARVALEYACRHSDRLSALVAVDFLPAVSQSRASRFIKRRPQATPVYPSREEILSRFRLQPEGHALGDDVLAALAETCIRRTKDGAWTWKYDWRAFSYEYAPIWNTLERVPVRTLIVRGEHSIVVSKPDFARIARELKGAQPVEIPGAHHHVPLDTPKELAAAVAAFLL